MQARRPTHAERCRTIAAHAGTATLSTLAREPAGYPYGSLVATAVDGAGRPILLLSELAEHTSNLGTSSRASILVAEAGPAGEEPLAAGRVTLLGTCRRVDGDGAAAARETYLSRHPRAAEYAAFKDFAFYRLEPEALRYVGGFGRMSWVTAEDYRAAEPDPLAPHARGIIVHMNDDHADAVLAYARVLVGRADATSARIVAVDRYGFDVEMATPAGTQAARLAFDAEATTSDAVRVAMIALLRRVRGGEGGRERT